MKYRTVKALGVTVVVLTLAATAREAQAATWGSIRANNRSYHPESRESHDNSRVRSGGGEVRREQEHTPAVISRPRQERQLERHVEIEHATREHRHEDIDRDRWHSYPWYGFHPGMIAPALPPGYESIYVGGTPYYYDQGVYYESGPSGYVVVTPPVGAAVPALPPGAEAVPVGSTVYYYAGGAFYQQQPQGFMVVTPPLGVTVSELPPGAAPVLINGIQYYQAEGAYFMPSMQGGVTVYTTVQP